MKKSTLNVEAFEKLLAWLDPSREVAGEKYDSLHFKLTKIFARRGCYSPEELADETMDRVMQKIDQVAPGYVGNPALYFYKVARYVFLEYLKPEPAIQLFPQIYSSEDKELRSRCLDESLDRLSAENKELILQYYQRDRGAKKRTQKRACGFSGSYS